MRDKIINSVRQAIQATEKLLEQRSLEFIEEAAHLIANTYLRGGKLLAAGNGGSLCDAMHFCEELTGYFRQKRKALPAIALADPGHMSCVANDTSFADVFSRGVEALGAPGDVLILLSTSGNSDNIVNAAIAAKALHIKTIAFLGKGGGRLQGQCDLEWIVSDFHYTDRIQEAHMVAIHILIEMIEDRLFSPSTLENLVNSQA